MFKYEQKKSKDKIIIDPDIHYLILSYLEENPNITQRDLSQKLGISLGSINYCIKALILIGHIKIKNFNASPNKMNYLYLLTPSGVNAKISLTLEFLNRKVKEYEQLKIEINKIKSKLNNRELV